MESPRRAPQASENKNFTIISKVSREQHFFASKSRIAAKNPIREIAKPAKNPKPQISD